MKSGDRTINWISTGYRVAMKRLRTSLSRRLAFSLRRRRRRNLRRRRPPLRLPELWSLRKQKWSKLSQKRWWNLKRRKWFRCSKGKDEGDSSFFQICRSNDSEQTILCGPRCAMCPNSVGATYRDALRDGHDWRLWSVSCPDEQRALCHPNWTSGSILSVLNWMNTFFSKKWVSDRKRESERKAVIDLLFHIVNPLLFCFLFFLYVVVGVKLWFHAVYIWIWLSSDTMITLRNQIPITVLHFQSHLLVYHSSNHSICICIFGEGMNLKSISHFGISFDDKVVSSLMERERDSLFAVMFLDRVIGIALSQDEWRVVIRSLVCLFRFEAVIFQSSFELESVIFWVSAHLSFLWISIFNTVNVLTMLSKPCIAYFCVCFCFYCFRSNLPIDRESYHLLQCIIHWKIDTQTTTPMLLMLMIRINSHPPPQKDDDDDDDERINRLHRVTNGPFAPSFYTMCSFETCETKTEMDC